MTRTDASPGVPAVGTEAGAAERLPARRGPLSRRIRGGWLIESLVIVVVMVVHDLFRNELTGSRVESLRRARALESVERTLGIHHELTIQRFFLDWPFIVGVWNVYYQWAHFIVPIVAAIYLYRKFPARYVRWRNVFLVMLFVTGPFGWWAFPVTPPKYLPAKDGFVDTQVEYFSIGTMKPLEYGPDGEPRDDLLIELGNPYSGLPSHHVSWAIWVVCALWPVVRRRWVKGLLALHIVLTCVGIAVTANHHLLDIAASCVEVLLAFCLVLGLEALDAWWKRWRQRIDLDALESGAAA